MCSTPSLIGKHLGCSASALLTHDDNGNDEYGDADVDDADVDDNDDDQRQSVEDTHGRGSLPHSFISIKQK